MPETLWSAPISNLGIVSNSAAVAAALTDYSPQAVVIPPGTITQGTRLRFRATGSYVSSAATATPTWGFYMSNVGTALVSGTSLQVAATAATTVVSTGSASWPWTLEWEGHCRTVSTSVAGTATYFGQGKFYQPASIVAFSAPVALPATLLLRTVTQIAGGGNTNLGQMISVGIFPNVTTGLATITCDELTVELLG